MNSVSTSDWIKSGKIRYLDHPPYQIVGEVKPFPQNMTAFSRIRRDPTCIGYGESRSKSVSEIIADGKPGYSRVGFSLKSAAWTIVSAMSKQAYSGDKIGGRSSGIESKYIPEDMEEFTDQVKRAARLYGASIVGMASLDRRWIYSTSDGELLNIPDDVNTVVVMGVEMDRELIKHSPSPLSGAATGNGYSRMVFTTACLAEFLRDLGWKAIGCGNDTALSIPLAMDAGLGECGGNGMLITPEFGSRLRLCKVLTDAPLVPGKPIEFGAMDFCERCGKCALACPADAITAGEQTSEALCPSNNPGVLKWPVHAEKCLRYWRINGTDCANCISSCPLSS
jgi:ferredoxin